MTKFDTLNLTSPHTMRELEQAECETSDQGDIDMKMEDKDAIKALIGAIDTGRHQNIVIALWKSADLLTLPLHLSIEDLMLNVSAAIEFQRDKLPNCGWIIHSSGYAYIVGPDGLIESSAHNYSPATALVVATLRAMLATNE